MLDCTTEAQSHCNAVRNATPIGRGQSCETIDAPNAHLRWISGFRCAGLCVGDEHMNNRPNPGSPEAIASGCRCAVMDNNHGKYAPFQPDGWWVTVGCPVHKHLELDGLNEEETAAFDAAQGDQ